jgi:curved DNA-binding protein CbpA
MATAKNLNPYRVLGLEYGATQQEIKIAHKKLALK